jgi:ferric-dicitrate binding protein FerR (iron transport regulator)
LSDGTEVHLNYGSSIKYPRTFNGDTREITLSGEGYFDVAHNPDKPFIVKTKKLNIKALGTSFNVMAYPDNDRVATTLVEGKVVLEHPDANEGTKPIGSMVPGQHADYHIHTGNISSTIGNIKKYIAWKDGLLVFDNSGIKEVADRLERMFNVDIEIADEIIDYTYTVTFVDEPLFQILELISHATPVTYKMLPRKKQADGTFSKQKILLKKR